MSYTYAVLGAGRQGTATAYDMARWGDARRVLLADRDLALASAASHRVNELLGQKISEPIEVDVRDRERLERFLRDVDSCLSAVPCFLNLDITRAAVRAGCHLCDLGGNTGIARDQHRLDGEAQRAGVSVIPNCGQVPGMGTTLMVYAMELLDEAIDVYMWDGGIPQTPRSPFQYLLTFNIVGLTNEYAETAVFLRDWELTEVEPMTEVESVEFGEPFGTLEAFVTGGGTDTMPWTYQGKIRNLQNKTLRYPGHFAQLRAFYDLGIWDLEPVNAGDVEVVPRDVFHSLFEPKVSFPEDRDAVLVRIRAVGKKSGRDAEACVETIDYFDDATGFTAMERCTGWSAAIVAEMMAKGETRAGAGGVEAMVPARPFVESLRHRGIGVSEEVNFTS
jgi:lysine 6-dehydrogenase